MRRGSRGPVRGIGGVGRVDRSMSVAPVQALASLSSATRVHSVGSATGYTFAQALERSQRGLVRADPLPSPARPRPPLPPHPDDQEPVHDAPTEGSFLKRLVDRIARGPELELRAALGDGLAPASTSDDE